MTSFKGINGTSCTQSRHQKIAFPCSSQIFSYTTWPANTSYLPWPNPVPLGTEWVWPCRPIQLLVANELYVHASSSNSFASCESCVEGAAVLLVGLWQSFGVILGVDILLATSPLEHSVTYSVPLTQSPIFFQLQWCILHPNLQCEQMFQHCEQCCFTTLLQFLTSNKNIETVTRCRDS